VTGPALRPARQSRPPRSPPGRGAARRPATLQDA
jgi:hypothetical protein